jgi:hypothetical protein
VLASVLAQPHAVLAAISMSDAADVLAYESVLPGGKHAVAFIDTSTSSAETVPFRPYAALVRDVADVELQRREPERDELRHRHRDDIRQIGCGRHHTASRVDDDPRNPLTGPGFRAGPGTACR